MEKIIEEVVDSLYEKAISDFLIGYHFKKIQTGEALHPTLSDFAHHLPRIKIFWKFQLLKGFKNTLSFNLKETHIPLKIHKGELDRFMLLFNETLEQFEKTYPRLTLFNDWRSRLQFFYVQFVKFI